MGTLGYTVESMPETVQSCVLVSIVSNQLCRIIVEQMIGYTVMQSRWHEIGESIRGSMNWCFRAQLALADALSCNSLMCPTPCMWNTHGHVRNLLNTCITFLCVCRVVQRLAYTNAGRHCSHSEHCKSQALARIVSHLPAFDMIGWQYKLMNELDRTRAATSDGWSKSGVTAASRLEAILAGNIPLHTGVFLQTSPCVSYKWYCSEVMQDPTALVLMRNDPKAGGQSRFMLAKPIGSLALGLHATPCGDDKAHIVVTFLSGLVLMEHEVPQATPVKSIFEDVRACLEARGGYTEWDLQTLSIVHGGTAVRPAGSAAKLLQGSGKGQSKCMGQGKGNKVLKRPALKRQSAGKWDPARHQHSWRGMFERRSHQKAYADWSIALAFTQCFVLTWQFQPMIGSHNSLHSIYSHLAFSLL